MGRYLSCAVATSMVVEKKNDKPLDKEELNKLKKSVGKIFDLDLYNVKEEENLISLEIKKDIFNANIHELCRELNKSFFLLTFLLFFLDPKAYGILTFNHFASRSLINGACSL